MSDTNTNQNTGPDYKAAEDVLMDHVFAPVFFNKLAQDHGLAPANEQEAIQYIQLAQKLDYLDNLPQNKAAAPVSAISKANSYLDELLGAQPQRLEERAVKQAAQECLQTPALRNAALVYQDAINQIMAGN